MQQDSYYKTWVKGALFLTLMCLPLSGVASADAPPHTTILGIFRPLSPEDATALGAKAVRVFVSHAMLKQGGHSQAVAQAADFKRAGFTVIATVSYGNKQKQPLSPIDSAQWKELLDQFDAFLRAAAPSIDYIAVGNEPVRDMNAADYKPQGDGKVPAIDYFRALASHAQAVIHSDPAFAHIKVSSPALFNIPGLALKEGGTASLLLDWEANDPNIDVVDIHTHVTAVSEIDYALNFIGQKTHKPVIITEWSQARAGYPWLKQSINPGFAQKWHVAQQTNGAFLKACYDKPVSKAQWDEFITGAPFDASFMKDAFAIIVKHGVLVATYGAGMQYGDVKFDTKQLLANRTVVAGPDGKPQENYLFTTWYRDLAKAYQGQ